MQPPAIPPLKFIPPARDRLQSRILVWTIAPLIYFAGAIAVTESCLVIPRISSFHQISIAVSLLFALLVWRLKAATPAAAACGGVICLLLTFSPGQTESLHHTALPPLIALFVLTYAATRAGRYRKASAGLAESRKGRRASQIIANLSVAALISFPISKIIVISLWPGHDYHSFWVGAVLVLSTLTEATADTVSSEIGQAFGGRPFLLTTLRRVAPGTDGAVSLLGTLAGILAAVIVAATGAWSVHLSLLHTTIALAAGICGLFFDSLLGATLEHRGWLGNDLVNFCSTIFSPSICILALLLIPKLGPEHL